MERNELGYRFNCILVVRIEVLPVVQISSKSSKRQKSSGPFLVSG